MPRPPRADEARALYHPLNRGNARGTNFHKDEDYEAFERILAEGLERYHVRLFGYELMPNHRHLVLRPDVTKSRRKPDCLVSPVVMSFPGPTLAEARDKNIARKALGGGIQGVEVQSRLASWRWQSRKRVTCGGQPGGLVDRMLQAGKKGA